MFIPKISCAFSRRLVSLPLIPNRTRLQLFISQRGISDSNKCCQQAVLSSFSGESKAQKVTKRLAEQELERNDPEEKEYDDPWKSAPSAVVTHSTPVKSDGKYISRAIVYWGENDPQNIDKLFKFNEFPTRVHVNLKAILLALNQAIDRNVKKLHIILNDEYISKVIHRYLQLWKKNGYKKRDGSNVKHTELMQELAQLMELIDIKAKFEPNLKCVIKGEELPKEPEQRSMQEKIVASTDDSIDFSDAETFYVEEVVSTDKLKRKIAAYGVYNPRKNSELSESGRCEGSATHMRAQMQAIQRVMDLALDNGLDKVKIVMEKGYFVQFWKYDWKKKDGKVYPNEDMYQVLKQMAQKIPAQFIYHYKPTGNIKTCLNKALEKAQDGLAILTTKDKKWAEMQQKKAQASAKESKSRYKGKFDIESFLKTAKSVDV